VDAETFIQTLTIYNKALGRLGYFSLNPAQQQVLPILESKQRIIIVKARQLGISTLVRAWHFYKAFYAQEPHTYAVISHTRDSAEHLAGLDTRFYDNLPRSLQRPLSAQTKRSIVFEDSGASVRCYTAGGRGGTRSFAVHAAHLSEFAFGVDQEELLAQVLASAGRGQVVIESTVNQVGDTFHKLVTDSLAGENDWHVVFLPWTIEPTYRVSTGSHHYNAEEKELLEGGLERQQVWWRRHQIKLMGRKKFAREFPATVQEAFQVSEDWYYDRERLGEVEVLNLGTGDERAYPGSGYDPEAEYIIGVDTGGGAGGDYSALTVLNTVTMQPELHFVTNRHSPTSFTEVILTIAHRYGNPLLVVEGRSWGYVVLTKLQELSYPALWKERGAARPGWDTNVRTRPLLFEALREILEGGLLIQADRDFLKQLRQCTIRKGRPDHPKGSHDDILVSAALAYVIALRNSPKVERSPKGALIDEWKRKQRAKKARRPLPWQPAGLTRRRG
jgi:hypothetical protein